MAAINPERYTPLLKGYLTYPSNSITESELLTDVKRPVWTIEIDGKNFVVTKMRKGFLDAIKSVGGKATKTYQRATEGKKNVYGINVEVRKITSSEKLASIRLRVTGNNVTELVMNMEKIKSNMAKYGFAVTECLWTRSGDMKTPTKDKKPVVEESQIKKDLDRLRSKIESQQLEIAELKEKPIKKAMWEDREVFKGVIN